MLKKIQSNRNNKGIALAQAAFVLPFVLAIIFFIFEVGMMLYTSNNLKVITNVGARYIAVNPNATSTDIVNQTNASSLVKNVALLTITIDPVPGSTRNIGDTVTVQATYNYSPVLNPLSLLMSSDSFSTFNLQASSNSIIEIST